jgi:hypothetical protein
MRLDRLARSTHVDRRQCRAAAGAAPAGTGVMAATVKGNVADMLSALFEKKSLSPVPLEGHAASCTARHVQRPDGKFPGWHELQAASGTRQLDKLDMRDRKDERKTKQHSDHQVHIFLPPNEKNSQGQHGE